MNLGGSTDTFTYSWNFGDGSAATVAAPVTNTYNLSATHTYTAAAGTAYTAVLTVTDTTTTTNYTGNYPVVVQANTLSSRVNVAVDNGLWYLHLTMWRNNTTNPASQTVPWGGWDTAGGGSQNCNTVGGSALDCTYAGGVTAQNTQAFEVSGHLENGPATDPYTDDVARGLARVEYFLLPKANNSDGPKVINYNPAVKASRCSDGSLPNYTPNPPTCTAPATLILYAQGATSCTNPPCTFTFDGNNNGQMLVPGNDSGEPGYEAGMYLTALVATSNMTGVAKAGSGPPVGTTLPGVYNQTYLNLVQDLADGIGYCQYFGDQNNSNGYGNGGGWEYYCAANASDASYYDDNSVSQWNAIGLIAANRGFGISIPPIVTDTNQVWTAWDENVTTIAGQFGYDSWSDPLWGPWAVTPSGMVQMAMDGTGRTAVGVPDQRWNMAESYYHDNFCSSGTGAFNNPKLYTYGLFSFTKSMEQHDPGGVLTPITFLLDVPSGTNPIDWYGAQASAGAACDGVAQTLVARQRSDGSWYGVDYTSDQYYFETAWSVQMLQKTSFTACVTDLSGTGQAGPSASLTWTGVGSVTNYNVQRSSTNGGPYATLAKVAATSYTDSDPALVGGNTYYYVVQPLNSDGTAICASNQASVPIPAGGANGSTLSLLGGDGGTVPLGSPVSVALRASGGTPPYTWTAVSAVPPGMAVSPASVSGTPTQPGNYAVAVQVTDSAKPAASVSATATYSVFGLLSNTLPPGITFSPYLASVGVAGGRQPYNFSFSFLPPGLNGSSSGTIQGTVRAPINVTINVTATEAGGVSVTAPVTLTFTAPAPLSVNAGPLPVATVNTAYSAALSATGGAQPLTWALSSGALPPGLSLNPSGIISGTPLRTGTTSFGVRATDLTGASVTGTVSIAVMPTPLVITTVSPLVTGTSGVEYPRQTINATGGVPPYTFAVVPGANGAGGLPNGVNLNPNGILSGTPAMSGNFQFTIMVTDNAPAGGSSIPVAPKSRGPRGIAPTAALEPRAATASANFALNIRTPSTDLLLNTATRSFTLAAGAMAVPASQTIGVVSTSATPVNYTTSIAPAGANWLQVSGGGVTPGVITVGLTMQALGLAASTTPYSATVVATCVAPSPCAGNTQTVTVNLTVTQTAPRLNIPATLLSFTTPASLPQVQSQGLTVQDTGGGSIGIQSASCEATWCTVGGIPGSIAAGAPGSVNVTADPTGMAAGFYRTAVDLKTSAGLGSVPVTLYISTASGMTLQPSGTLFQSVAGGVPNGGLNSFLVAVVGTTPVNWTASVLPGSSWLSVSTPSGSATGTSPGTVSFSIDPTKIPTPGMAGTYYGTVRVSAPGVSNTPLDFQVVLNNSAAGSPKIPAPSPAGLLFISAAGTQPPSQTVTIATNTMASVGFSASASGGSWLSVSPGGGTAAPGSPGSVQVSVNPSNLNAGTYTGGVTFSLNGGADEKTVNVTLVVPLAGQQVQSDRPGSPAPDATSTNCTATQIIPVQMGLLNNFSAPVGFPAPYSIQLLNNCGAYVSTGQVVATFSNGDAALPLSVVNSTTGLYGATWTPQQAADQVTVSTTASVPGFAPVTIQLTGSVTPNAVPVLAPNSTLNVYNPVNGAALAPGTIVQITGSALAGSTATASAPYPTTLGGTQVTIGGISAPLASVSPGVLTAQVPFELTPSQQYQVVVSSNGALTAPAPVQISRADPGVAVGAGGLVTADHANGSPISEASPAVPGETIVLVGVGLGLTDASVADGAASPSSPLANVLDKPTVTINNEAAVMSFAGLQPGEVGVYQINVQVPNDAPNGDLTLVVSQDGIPANTATLPVKAAM